MMRPPPPPPPISNPTLEITNSRKYKKTASQCLEVASIRNYKKFVYFRKGPNDTVGLYEPPRGKTNTVVSDQVRHKPDCTVTEDS